MTIIIANLLKIIAIILLSVNGLFVYFIIIIIILAVEDEEDMKLLLTRLFLLGIIFLRMSVYLYLQCNKRIRSLYNLHSFNS